MLRFLAAACGLLLAIGLRPPRPRRHEVPYVRFNVMTPEFFVDQETREATNKDDEFSDSEDSLNEQFEYWDQWRDEVSMAEPDGIPTTTWSPLPVPDDAEPVPDGTSDTLDDAEPAWRVLLGRKEFGGFGEGSDAERHFGNRTDARAFFDNFANYREAWCAGILVGADDNERRSRGDPLVLTALRKRYLTDNVGKFLVATEEGLGNVKKYHFKTLQNAHLFHEGLFMAGILVDEDGVEVGTDSLPDIHAGPRNRIRKAVDLPTRDVHGRRTVASPGSPLSVLGNKSGCAIF